MAEISTNEVTTMSYERPVIDKGYVRPIVIMSGRMIL